MYNSTVYKPSNKFSPLGIVLMFFSILAVGFIISWLYLIINSVIPLIYLNIILAAGVSFGLGAIGAFFVKIYKIRAPKLAVIVSLVALLFVNYAKWGIYCARDYDKYMYSDMKETKVTRIIGDETVLPKTKEEAATWLLYFYELKGTKISYMMKQYSDYIGYSSFLTIFGDDLYDIYTNIFGSTADEIYENCQKIISSPDMSLYDYMYKYRNLQVRNAFWFITHPADMFQDIKDINQVGRWTIKSHRFSNSDLENNNIKGFVLWLVWIGELGFLMIPALYLIYTKAKYPFIESEDEWAVEEKPMPTFLFEDPYPNQSSSPQLLKNDIMRTPDCLFSLNAVSVVMAVPEKHYKLTYCRSKYYDEIYATVNYVAMINPRKNQRKTVNVVTNLKVDADFLATLYGKFGYTVPILCKGENRAAEFSKENTEKAQAAAATGPKSPTPPKATGAEAIFDEPLFNKPAKKQPAADSFAQQELKREQQAAAASRPTSGDMDGIDTSSLNLDDIDLNHM